MNNNTLTTNPPTMSDSFGRRKRKLRISLTDRCQFRCLYCMPQNPKWLPREDILRREEITRLAKLFITQLGINQIRLTGGEPLLRKDASACVAALSEFKHQGLDKLSMTSNGVLLPRYAKDLQLAGLDSINVSLDILDPQRFQELTKGQLSQVLQGIDAARNAGISVKINAVAIKGYNDNDLLPLVHWAKAESLTLRFIEFMPLDGDHFWAPEKVITEADIIKRLQTEFSVQALPRGSAPATEYLIDGQFKIGIISTVSKPFCKSCDRVRLTATGQIYSCLFGKTGFDLRNPLRDGATDLQLQKHIQAHILQKPAGYIEQQGYVERQISMHALGG